MNWTLEYLVEETEVTVDIGVAVGSFILSACVVLFNGLLLLSVLLHCTKTKVTTIKLLIINSAAADLLQGALINPFHGYQAFSEWKLSRMWCEAWSTLEPTIFVISTLSLFSINIDRLIYVTNPEKYSKCLQIKLTALLIAIPWIMGSLIIPPLYVLGEDTSFLKPPKAPLCVLIPKQPVIRTIFTLCSIIGTAILIIFLVIFCMVFRSPGIRSYGLVKDTDSTSIRNKILALCTVNSFFFLLRFPWIYSPHSIRLHGWWIETYEPLIPIYFSAKRAFHGIRLADAISYTQQEAVRTTQWRFPLVVILNLLLHIRHAVLPVKLPGEVVGACRFAVCGVVLSKGGAVNAINAVSRRSCRRRPAAFNCKILGNCHQTK
ncbi:unnamed protein product [Acanthosepion pharaonis]|uniref:G-protein coupled receptors family 1 profile domain-containing protein n=1 Tax=Acanthosepion pharaonis TaxID=158019 RepID=A0A812B0G8_ACAPH|nr:unnamed protein product [Sepia pharaonis]